MTREELQKVRDAALTVARECQPKTPEDMAGALATCAWLALAEAADHLDALLARGEDIFAGVEDGEEEEDKDGEEEEDEDAEEEEDPQG